MTRNLVYSAGFRIAGESLVIASLLGLALIALTVGCQQRMKDEKALANVDKVAVDVYVDETLSMDAQEFAWFSARFPALFSALLKDNAESVDKIIDSRASGMVSFQQIKSLHKDPTTVLAENPNDLVKSRVEEAMKFRSESTRRDLTPELARSSGSDAVLWIHARYSSRMKPPSYEANHGQLIAPGISWQVQLFNQDGQKIWADAFSKVADQSVSIGSWTQEQSGTVVTTSLSLDQVAMAQFNREAAAELAATVLDSLTKIVAQARSGN